jgi:hypothetical protein
MDERNRMALSEFVEKRRAYLQAKQGTEEDMRRFRQRYPDWDQIAPSRFASHFFLMSNSELYRAASGQDIESDALDLELLGKPPKKGCSPLPPMTRGGSASCGGRPRSGGSTRTSGSATWSRLRPSELGVRP